MTKSVTWTLGIQRETKNKIQFRDDPDSSRHVIYVPKEEVKQLGKAPEDAQLEVVLRWKKAE